MSSLDDLHHPSPPLPRPRRRRWLRATGAAVAVIGLAGAVAVFGKSRVDDTATVVDLRVGDCLDEPLVDEVAQLDIIDCIRPHQLEVFAVVERDDPPGAPFPGTEELLRWAAQSCESEFEPYVGIGYRDSDLFLSHFTPEADGWEEDDRGVVCVLYSVDENLLTATVRGSAHAAKR